MKLGLRRMIDIHVGLSKPKINGGRFEALGNLVGSLALDDR
jgi:hypothetical protein